MEKKKHRVMWLTQGAAIAALYVVLTVVFAPISFGVMQVRVSEMMTMLPLFTSAAVPGLCIGCFLANLLGGAVVWDMLFGSIATLIGAALGYLLRFNRWLVPIPSVISNALIIPLVLQYGYGMTDMPYALMAVYVAVGELIGCYILGELLASFLQRCVPHIFGRK